MTIGVAGGTVTTADGNASIDIPAGALAEDVVVTIVPDDSVPSEELGRLVSGPFDFGPDGLEFTEPTTLTLAYDEVALEDANPSELVVGFSSDGNEWLIIEEAPMVDEASRTVSVMVTHFTRFALLSPPPTVSIVDTYRDASLDSGSPAALVLNGVSKIAQSFPLIGGFSGTLTVQVAMFRTQDIVEGDLTVSLHANADGIPDAGTVVASYPIPATVLPVREDLYSYVGLPENRALGKLCCAFTMEGVEIPEGVYWVIFERTNPNPPPDHGTPNDFVVVAARSGNVYEDGEVVQASDGTNWIALAFDLVILIEGWHDGS